MKLNEAKLNRLIGYLDCVRGENYLANKLKDLFARAE